MTDSATPLTPLSGRQRKWLRGRAHGLEPVVHVGHQGVTDALLAAIDEARRGELIKRVFARDVLECPRCGGRMKIIATVTDPEAVLKILTCIGLPARPPPVAPAREREQAELGLEG